jgi:hypothetical protein
MEAGLAMNSLNAFVKGAVDEQIGAGACATFVVE